PHRDRLREDAEDRPRRRLSRLRRNRVRRLQAFRAAGHYCHSKIAGTSAREALLELAFTTTCGIWPQPPDTAFSCAELETSDAIRPPPARHVCAKSLDEIRSPEL